MSMPLSIAKCLVLQWSNNNPQLVFVCGNALLPTTNELCDLGVTRTAAQKFSANTVLVAAKAYRASGAILRSLRPLERKLLWAVFSANVFPILNYAFPAWNPHLRRDVNLLENIQRRYKMRLWGLS